MIQIWSIWLIKQVNTILPDEEDPAPESGIGEGIRPGMIVGDKVGVEMLRNGGVKAGETVGEPKGSTCIAVERGTGGFCQA